MNVSIGNPELYLDQDFNVQCIVMKLNRRFLTPMREPKKLCPFTQSQISNNGANTVDMAVSSPNGEGGRRGISSQEVVIEENG